MIKNNLNVKIPVFHAINLVAQYLIEKKYKAVLLLATKATLEDGFFAKILEERDIEVIIPTQEERDEMQKIHNELMRNIITEKSRNYFSNLIAKHHNLDAVILGCTEYPLVVDAGSSVLPIIDPVYLQATHAVSYIL